MRIYSAITKRKRTVVLLFLTVSVIFFAVSCTHRRDNVLYYQRHAAAVTGTLITDTGEFYVRITLSLYDTESDTEEVTLRDALIEFTYPEEIKGYTVNVFGGNVTAALGGITVPILDDEECRAFDIVSLFSIPEDTLSSVTKNDEDGVTAVFGDKMRFFISFDSASGMPVMIEKENGIKLKIDGYFLE